MPVYLPVQRRPPEQRKSDYAAAAADYKFSDIRVLNEFVASVRLNYLRQH
jgi:hypothetical protein